MASLIKMLLIIGAIQIVLTMTGVMDIPGTAIFLLMSGVTPWSATALVTVILDLGVSVGGLLLIAGTIMPGRNDLTVFAGALMVLITYGAAIGLLGVTIFAEADAIFGGGAGRIFTMLFIGPLYIIYLFVAVSWWKGRAD